MKWNFARGTAVAAVALGFGGLAQAVPIYFDFTGTVTGVSGSTYPSPNDGRAGQSYSAGFTFETERLFGTPLGSHPVSQTFIDFSNPGPGASSSHLAIGSEIFPFPSQPNQYTMMTFNDSCSPAPPTCTPQWAEDLVLFGYNSDMPLDSSTATGTFHSTSLLFISSVPMVPIDPANPFGGQIPAFDYFDVTAGIDPTAILTLPMYEMFATYYVSDIVCDNGSCAQGNYEQTSMSVSTVTRGVASSVPEPGTLGLLGVALAGMLLLRRVPRTSRSSTRNP